MKLNLHQIREITQGAVGVKEEQDKICFFRFTKEQEEIYSKREYFYFKTFATSGIKLCFKTNSTKFKIKGVASCGSARSYYCFELFVNKRKFGELNNFQNGAALKLYPLGEFPLGGFETEWQLGEGEKLIELIFPWSVKIQMEEISLDDDCYIEAVRPKQKLLCFGDSITHGYDALYPGMKYTSRLAEALGAEEFNKGIGGELFFPALAETREAFEPDYITVAYGTNDWARRDREAFVKNCNWFFKNLCKNYPSTKIYAISPLWRRDMDESKSFGPFTDLDAVIGGVVSKYENVRFISGFNILPHSEEWFADKKVHPNDEGFYKFFECLRDELKG